MKVILTRYKRALGVAAAFLGVCAVRADAGASVQSALPALSVSMPSGGGVSYNLTGNKYVTHRFVLTNNSGKSMQVDRIQASCGCTTASADHKLPSTVQPGKFITVTLRISLDRLAAGPYKKKAWVYCHDRTEPAAELDAAGVIPSSMKPLPVPAFASAPDFRLLDLNGKPFHLQAERGRNIALFSFCGCPECARVARLWSAKQTANWAQLQNAACLCVIDYTGPRSTIAAFLRSSRLDSRKCTVLQDPKDVVGSLYHADACPRAFAIDRNGIIGYTNNHPDDRPYAGGGILVQRTYASLFTGGLSD